MLDLHALQAENTRLRAQVERAEREQRATKRLLQTIIDTLSPMVIGWKDRSSVYLGCNQPVARLAGLTSPEEIVGKTDFDLPWKREEAEFFRQIDKQVMDDNAPMHDIIEPLREANGRQTWVKTNKVPLHDEAGSVVGLVYTLEDITERKQYEQDLSTERGLTSAVLGTASFLIILLDREGRVVRFNPAAEESSGYSTEEVVGRRFWEVLAAEEERPRMAAAFKNPDALPLPGRYEERWLTKGGSERLIAWSSVAIRDASGRVEHILSTGLDITERRRAEQERAALQAQVIEAQRAVLREVSTPLIPIARGVVAMPLIGTIDDQRANQVIETLLHGVSAHRAATVILDVTGVQDIDARCADVLVQATKMVGLLGAQAILTGIQPAIARALVRTGVDLGGVRTLASLEAGIAAALRRG